MFLKQHGERIILKAGLYIKLLRIKHWIKNMLIYIPMTFSGGFLDLKNQRII